MPVIDVHIHITQAEEYSDWFLHWAKRQHGHDIVPRLREVLASPASLLRFLDGEGVDYAVVLPENNPSVTGVCPNERVGSFAQTTERLIPFASINPLTTPDAANELDRSVSDYGFRGLKLYPTYHHFYPNDERLFPLYDRAQDLGMPVMFHTGSSVFPNALMKFGDPLALDDVAIFFPRLVIIQAHSGRGFWYDRAFFLSVLHENVYMDITGLPPRNLLKYFPDLEKNQDKVLFGSDWPVIASIKDNIGALRHLPIRQEAMERILGLNAARLFGIKA